jgi:hypothetical protein
LVKGKRRNICHKCIAEVDVIDVGLIGRITVDVPQVTSFNPALSKVNRVQLVTAAGIGGSNVNLIKFIGQVKWL